MEATTKTPAETKSILADIVRADGRTVVVRMPSADEARRLADAIMAGAIRRRDGQLTGVMLGILRDRAALAESATVI